MKKGIHLQIQKKIIRDFNKQHYINCIKNSLADIQDRGYYNLDDVEVDVRATHQDKALYACIHAESRLP